MHVLIAEKSLLKAQAFANYLISKKHIVDIATSLAEASALLRRLTPNLILLDYHLHPADLISWIQELRASITYTPFAIVLIVPHFTPMPFATALDMGINGIIEDSDDIEVLNACINEIGLKSHYLSSTAHQEFERKHGIDPLTALTPSEREIAYRILSGQSTKEIASTLFRSIETIQNHRKAIRQKLGISGGKFALLNYLLARESFR